MNTTRNIIIGVVVVLVVIGGAFLLMGNNANNAVAPASTTNTTQNTTPTTPSTPATPPAPAPAPVTLTPGAPDVQTNASVSVSSSTAVVTGQVRPNGAFTTYWYDYGETTALTSRTVSQSVGSGYSLVSTPAFITGLKANTVYYFRLSANNRFATVNGNTSNFQTNNNPPPTGRAPSVSTNNATNVARTSANVNGTVNPNGFDTNVWFEYGTDANLGSVTSLQGAGTGNSNTAQSMTLSSLQPQTRYFFRMNAQNQFGTVTGTILNFTTAGPAVPSIPTVSTTSASSLTTTGAKLNGRINPNGEETTYWFEYALDPALNAILNTNPTLATVPAGNNNVNVNLSVTGLVGNTLYFYRLVGQNSAGTAKGSIMSFKTR